jgi:hypothetical protein
VGGREEQRREDREDVDEGRSCDWLEIGEIIKKRSSKKFYIDVCCSSVCPWEEFFHPPLRKPDTAPPGITTLNETLIIIQIVV